MTERIIPNLDNTEKLLEQVLSVVLDGNRRVAFLVPAGQAFKVNARIRVMISRRRKSMLARGMKPKRFELRYTVHSETHDGMRYDCMVMWRRVAESHKMMEVLEDLLVHG